MINEKDIADMKEALSILTREELELLCLDRAIRADGLSCVLTPEQRERFNRDLNSVPISEHDMNEMNRIMELVRSQIDVE